MNTGTRRQFTAAFKRKVIEFAEVNGNMAAQRQFGVSEKSVRYWRNQKSKLSVCNARKTSFRGRRAVHPELEDKVADFVREYRAKSLPVNAELIRSKAVELAREAGLSKKDFKGSIYWVRRFMRRKGFALRRRTSICQKLPEMYEDKLIEFQLYVNNLRRQHGYMLGQIGNADETPVWFDMPSSTTVCERGAKEVRLLSTGSEHSRFTVMLCCTADGRKLPPFIIFKRKTMPKEAFPRDVVVRVNEKGYMDEALMREWIRTVWNRRPGALLQRRNMLVLDAFRGHLTASVKESLRDGRTDLVVIPGGMTSTLQPLDVVLNKPFKDRVRALYTEWMAGDNPPDPDRPAAQATSRD
uniref:Putative pogo transposable element n=1 Tax=Rhipicephalus microplus TaxID=6941 RepID=A0A6G5A925_RHIMP